MISDVTRCISIGPKLNEIDIRTLKNMQTNWKIIIVTLSLLLSIALAQQLEPTPQNGGILSVRGHGRVELEGLMIRISLGVSVVGRTASDAQSQASNIMGRVIQMLERYNVTDLQTDFVSLNAVYDYTPNGTVLRGYQSSNMVSFSLSSPDEAGEIIDRAVSLGINRIDQISFVAPREEQARAQKEALRLAVVDALDTGDIMLQALGQCKARVLSTTIGGAPPYVPQNYRIYEAEDASGMPTPVVPGRQFVETFVDLRIQHRNC